MLKTRRWRPAGSQWWGSRKNGGRGEGGGRGCDEAEQAVGMVCNRGSRGGSRGSYRSSSHKS